MEYSIIKRPRVTEKATRLADAADMPVYTFEVAPSATKATIAVAVEALYKVKPVSVRITKLPPRKVRTRQGVGRKPGVKKAVVTLKKGEKIEGM